MYETERVFAVETAAEACRLASRVQNEIVAQSAAHSKGDRSPVTIADLAIQAVVSSRLRTSFPNDPLLAEEDSQTLSEAPRIAAGVLDLARLAVPNLVEADLASALDRGNHEGGGAGRYWVLDPVDGTKGFLRGQHYAIALALVADGEVVVGVLGCPNLMTDPTATDSTTGCIFTAVRGEGTTVRAVAGGAERQVRTDGLSDPADAIMCESVESAHAAHSEHAAIADLLGITSQPYRIDSQCKYAIVARGEASIYLRLPSARGYREKVWDHAAGALVIEEAGGVVTDLDGNLLDLASGRYLGAGRGIIATNGNFHDRVLEAARSVLGEASSG